MGAQFSSQEYKDKLTKFKNEYLSLEHSGELDQFLQSSDDYANVFTSISLDDMRSIKEMKPDNIVHIVSHVSLFHSLIYLSWSLQTIKTMHNAATEEKVLSNEETI